MTTCPKCNNQIRRNVGSLKNHMRFCGRPIDADFFWSRMERLPWSGCWIWTGCTYNAGYGSVGWRFKPVGKSTMIAAHRAAWMLARGPIPAGIDVCHVCDVRLCCNPDHLFLGTHLENMRDMYRKGRAPVGERGGHAKLTEVQVREIRATYYWDRTSTDRRQGRGRSNAGELAEKYGVCRATITQIVNGSRWSHIYQGETNVR